MPGPRLSTRSIPRLITIRRVLSRAVSTAASGLALLLVAIGAVTMPSLLLLWATIGLMIGIGVHVVLRERAPSRRPLATGAVRRASVLSGVIAAGTCLLLAGLVWVVGTAAGPLFLFLVLLLVSMPRTWRALLGFPGRIRGTSPTTTTVPIRRRRARERRAEAVAASPVAVVPMLVTELSTPALCLAWRRSYLMLIDAPDDPGRHDLVAARRQMLDELERRDSAGFASWLAAGARAGSDPGRYLTIDQ